MDKTQTNGKVDDAPKDHWSKNTDRQFCYDFTEEVSAHRIHVVVNFSQEDRPFIREDQNDVLNSVEGNCHCHEEKSTISVLNTLWCPITVLEKNDGEASCDDCDNKLNIGSLRESDCVEEVSSNQETKLIHPSNLLVANVSFSYWRNLGTDVSKIILQR